MSGYPCLNNKRMQQILAHAGVEILSVASDRVVLRSKGDVDPLTKLILHLEPSAARGNLHMQSVEEAIAMGLVKP